MTWNLATSHATTAIAISQAAARYDLALTMHVAEDDLSAEAFIRRSVLHNLCGLLALWDSPAFEVSSLRLSLPENPSMARSGIIQSCQLT